jgi:hypothetical protein
MIDARAIRNQMFWIWDINNGTSQYRRGNFINGVTNAPY